MKKNSNILNFPKTNTPEELQMVYSCVITFGKQVLIAEHFYDWRSCKDCYLAAVYEHTSDDLSIEGEVRLVETSDEFFEDDGHAIAWAMGR